MAFTRNSGYATGTGNPNGDLTIKDGGGNIPTLYIDTATTPVTIYKFNSALPSGFKWQLMNASIPTWGTITNALGAIDANCAVTNTWYTLSISDGDFAGSSNITVNSDTITLGQTCDSKDTVQINLTGSLNTAALTVDTGFIGLRLNINNVGEIVGVVRIPDNSSGIVPVSVNFYTKAIPTTALKIEISSSVGTGVVAFSNLKLSLNTL